MALKYSYKSMMNMDIFYIAHAASKQYIVKERKTKVV